MNFLFEGGWLSLLYEYLIKSSVVLSAAIVLAFLLRKKSAGLRHLILSLFLIGLLLLPIFSTVTPGWETKFLPSRQLKDSAVAKVDGSIGTLASTSKNLGFFSMTSETQKQTEEVNTKSPSIMSNFLSRIMPVVGFAALLLWLSGLMFLSLRVVLGLYGTNRLAREGKVLHDSLWKRLLFRFLETVSIRKKIRLLSHDKTMIPFTWGVFKPIVMMPKESQNWSENLRSSALYHELSHIKRGDYFVMLLARISRAFYWFNPLSWIVLGMIKREQEKACDELVLKAGIKPSTYAENLLFIRNSVSGHWNPPAAVLGVVNKSHLNDRLTTILKKRFSLKEVQMKTKILLSLLAILSISFIGLARPGDSSGSHDDAFSVDVSTAVAPIEHQEESVVTPDQEKKEQKKELKKGVKIEEQEKKEQKKKAKKGVKIEVKEKDKDKTTLVLTTNKGDRKVFYITPPYTVVDKDKKGTWTIKADKLELSEGAKKIQLDEDCVIYIDKEDKDGVKVIKFESPHIQAKKAVKIPEHVTVDVHAVPHVEVTPNVHVVIDTEKYKKLIEKIREKLAKLKAKDLESDVKEVELEAIEEALEELQKVLKKKFEKSAHVDVHVSPKVAHSYTIRAKDIHMVDEKGHDKVSIITGEGTFSLIYHADIDTEQKEAYEKAVKKLESKLPEGYNVESTFDEGEGTLTIKVKKDKKSGEYKEAVESIDAMKKLIQEIQEELKKIKK